MSFVIKNFSMKYADLISRQKEYIPDKLQDKIRNCRIFLLGCGLGSQIGLLAARLGFENFVLIDGDNVDGHNLNRQGFRHEHLGQNKALVLSDMIKAINPNAKIEAYDQYLKEISQAKKIIDSCDVVVNMADPDEIMHFVNDYSQENNKPVFFPLNIIWGGYVLIFTAQSAKLNDIVDRKISGREFYFRLLEKTFSTFSPEILDFYRKKGEMLMSHPFLPQLGTAAYLSSSIVVSGIVKWLAKEQLRVAPKPIFLDLWEEMS